MPSFDAASYWENRLRGNVALEKIGYLGLGRQYNQWLYRVRKTVFRRTVKSLNVDLGKSSVLDVGSGSGFYIQQWKSLGAKEIVGLDITTAAVEHLQSKFPNVTFHKADIGEACELPAKGTFDLFSAFDVLFHIVDDARYRKAIANIHALLRPGGCSFSPTYSFTKKPLPLSTLSAGHWRSGAGSSRERLPDSSPTTGVR